MDIAVIIMILILKNKVEYENIDTPLPLIAGVQIGSSFPSLSYLF